MAYELRRVATPEDWAAMHAIRLATLFTPGRHAISVRYDENHADDRHPDNEPFVLVLDGKAIGVTRLDRRGADGGVVRLVAITPEEQRRGHGRMLQQLVDAAARKPGMRHLAVNAHSSAVGFYEKTGWRRQDWDPTELVGLAADCVQMTKAI